MAPASPIQTTSPVTTTPSTAASTDAAVVTRDEVRVAEVGVAAVRVVPASTGRPVRNSARTATVSTTRNATAHGSSAPPRSRWISINGFGPGRARCSCCPVLVAIGTATTPTSATGSTGMP